MTALPPPSAPLAADKDRVQPAPGFPLGALFVLTAVSCVVAAHVLPVLRAHHEEKISTTAILAASAGGGAILFVVGAVFGLMQRRPLFGSVCGAATGGVLGLLLTPIMLLPADRMPALLATSLGGSLLIIITALIVRAR